MKALLFLSLAAVCLLAAFIVFVLHSLPEIQVICIIVLCLGCAYAAADDGTEEDA